MDEPQALYVCEQIPDSTRKKDLGAFFRSIHGTLNHLLLVDRLWLARFLAAPFEFTSLGQELYAEFDELRSEREKTDAEILAWVISLSENQLVSPFTWRSKLVDRDFTLPLGVLVVHFFNHQTHHRGQLTTLLTQTGYDPEVTDLVRLPNLGLDGL